MKNRCVVFCLLPLLVLGHGATARAQGSATCGTPASSAPSAVAATDPLVEARILFIAFPETEDPLIPDWADALGTDLASYMQAMSRGAQELHIQVIPRPVPDDGAAWIASSPATYYQSAGHGVLNLEIMQQVEDAYNGAWSGVEKIIFVHYDCAFSFGCGFVGFAQENANGPGGFHGDWISIRNPYPPISTAIAQPSIESNAAHEYGHTIGTFHSPFSDPPVGGTRRWRAGGAGASARASRSP